MKNKRDRKWAGRAHTRHCKWKWDCRRSWQKISIIARAGRPIGQNQY